MILMIDNYDSFTYNLVQYLLSLGEEVKVRRNDDISVEEVLNLAPEIIVISPGPCTPKETANVPAIIKACFKKIPIFGICLGHQTIASFLGAGIIRAKQPVHGKVHSICHDGKGCFTDMPLPLQVTRYHSLVVDPATIPNELVVTAWSKENEIMGLRHTKYLLEGIQFHPEAILTEQGIKIIQNFLRRVRGEI